MKVFFCDHCDTIQVLTSNKKKRNDLIHCCTKKVCRHKVRVEIIFEHSPFLIRFSA